MPPKKICIDKLNLDVDLIKNKTTLLLGTSGTGKSKIILDMIYHLKEEIPICYIFCPTNKSNNTFTGLVPDDFIADDVDVETLEAIYKTQEMRNLMYNKCNDKVLLTEIAFKLNTSITPKIVQVNHSYLQSKKKLTENDEEYNRQYFVLQYRNYDIGYENEVKTLSTGTLAIKFCPWCGEELSNLIERDLEEFKILANNNKHFK